MSAKPGTTQEAHAGPMPDDWPRGASVERVRECNCESCRDLIRQLEGFQPSLDQWGERNV